MKAGLHDCEADVLSMKFPLGKKFTVIKSRAARVLIFTMKGY